jgi:hypothetical protein
MSPRISVRLFVTVGIGALCLAVGVPTVPGAKAAEGGKCTVTSGPNKGKSGTYTQEGSSTWCEGSWGGTECKDASGKSKCKDAALTTGGASTGGGTRFFRTADVALWQGFYAATQPGASRDALQSWSTKYKARVVTNTASQLTLALPSGTVTIDGDARNLVRNVK